MVFGPKPREYRFSLPHKALKQALNAALLAKMKDGQVIVVEAPAGEVKTKPVAAYMKAVGVAAGTSCLFVTGEIDKNFYKSARNINSLEVMPLALLNAYAVVRPSVVAFSRGAFEKLLEERR